jgi:hypothetical protein
MMQLVYDVAPGARLAFRTALLGQADFAACILQLAAAGCDVIVDDIIYYAEPMFQDGIIAQAVDQVVAQGIPFFSAAGNEARKSWIAPTGFNPVTIFNKAYHRFGTNSNRSPITIMRISMQGSSELRTFVVQWDETFASVSGPPWSRSDLDFVLRIGSFILIRNAKIIGVDPVELFQFLPSEYSTNATVTAELTIESYSGPLPTYMKLVVFGQVTSFEFDTKSSPSYGHPNAAQGAGVGAARYSSTPAFGISPPIMRNSDSVYQDWCSPFESGNSQPTPIYWSRWWCHNIFWKFQQWSLSLLWDIGSRAARCGGCALDVAVQGWKSIPDANSNLLHAGQYRN